jgi:Flp pilus assembly protein TadG
MLDRPRRNACGSRRGTAATEMAILLPVFAFLLVATIDYARVFYYGVTLTNCARNGAQWASNPYNYDPTLPVQSPYKNVTDAALADAPSLSPAPSVVAKYSKTASPTPYTSTTPIAATATSTAYVEVTVTWTFTTLIPYPGIPSTVTLSRAARMEIAPPS